MRALHMSSRRAARNWLYCLALNLRRCKVRSTMRRRLPPIVKDRLPGLSPEEARALLAAASPLAFWRKYRKQTQTSLAGIVGVTQNYLSEIENGKRGGRCHLWLRIAKALELPIEALIDEDD